MWRCLVPRGLTIAVPVPSADVSLLLLRLSVARHTPASPCSSSCSVTHLHRHRRMKVMLLRRRSVCRLNWLSPDRERWRGEEGWLRLLNERVRGWVMGLLRVWLLRTRWLSVGWWRSSNWLRRRTLDRAELFVTLSSIVLVRGHVGWHAGHDEEDE